MKTQLTEKYKQIEKTVFKEATEKLFAQNTTDKLFQEVAHMIALGLQLAEEDSENPNE